MVAGGRLVELDEGVRWASMSRLARLGSVVSLRRGTLVIVVLTG